MLAFMPTFATHGLVSIGPVQSAIILESTSTEEALVKAWELPYPAGSFYFETFACAYNYAILNDLDTGTIVPVWIDENMVLICP